MTPQCLRVEAGVQCPELAVGVVAIAFYPFASMMAYRCPTCGAKLARQAVLEKKGALFCPTCVFAGGALEPIPLRLFVLGLPMCAAHQANAALEELMIPSSLTTMLRVIESTTSLTVDPKGIKVIPVPFDDPDYQQLEAMRRQARDNQQRATAGEPMDNKQGTANPLAGLKPGRIVYYVFNAQSADEVNRRRTTGASIAERIAVGNWPLGAQAHIGNAVADGDVCPAMVLRVLGETGTVNLKVMLDGSDEYWATSVPFGEGPVIEPGTWHWMFDGQNTRYQPGLGGATASAGSEAQNGQGPNAGTSSPDTTAK